MNGILRCLALLPASILAGTCGASAADATPEPIVTPEQLLFSANFSAYGGYFNTFGSDRAYGPVFGGVGRVALAFSPTWTAQIDLSGEHTDVDSSYDGDYGAAFASLGGHLTYRTPAFLVGGLVSFGDRFDATWLGVAVEGQTQVGDALLLYGQAGRVQTIGGSQYEADDSSSHVHVSAKYFLHSNLMIEGNVGGAVYDDQSPGSVGLDTVLRYGGRLEYRFEQQPFSIFGEYQGTNWHWTDDATSAAGNWYEHTVLVGVRFAINEPTLWDSYSRGATLVDYNSVYGVNSSRLY